MDVHFLAGADDYLAAVAAATTRHRCSFVVENFTAAIADVAQTSLISSIRAGGAHSERARASAGYDRGMPDPDGAFCDGHR